MQTEKIIDLTRAIIYASATGMIVTVSGTHLADIEGQSSPAFPLSLQFAIVSSATLFIVMDGIVRYCVRANAEERGSPQLFIPGIRFVAEIVGLFAFSYWIGLLLTQSDPFSASGFIFLFFFSASCLLNNFLDVLVFSKAENPAQRVRLVGAAWLYGRFLVWGDIAESNIGKRFALIIRARDKIRNAVITPRAPAVTGNGGRDIWAMFTTGLFDLVWLVFLKIGVRGAFWRVLAQVGILHGVWFHLLAATLSILLIFNPVPNIIEARVSDLHSVPWPAFEPQYVGSLWIFGLMMLLAFLAYVSTSIKEQSRRQMAIAEYSESASPEIYQRAGIVERATQTAGNTLILIASVYMWYSAPIIALYIVYGILMVGAIAATMAGVHGAQSEPVSA